MEQIFIKILNMSLTSSVVILAVLLGRLALQRAPRIFSYALWAAVLFRLLCPVSFSSAFSLLGAMQAAPVEQGSVVYIPEDIGYEMEPEVHLPVGPVSDSVNHALPSGNPAGSVNPLQIWLFAGSLIWTAGLFFFLLRGLWQFYRLHRSLAHKKFLYMDGRIRIYETDFSTPFVVGILRPSICLPEGLAGEERAYILLHEKIHIRRGDPVFRLLAYISLAVHWFNPLVYLAYILSERDMEISCDEAVIRKMGTQVKKPYSASLLSLSLKTRGKVNMPLAFGEGNVKKRIEHILKYKRLPLAAAGILAAICLAAVYLLAANPKADSPGEQKAESASNDAEVQESVSVSETPTALYGVLSYSESSAAPLQLIVPGRGFIWIPQTEEHVLEHGDLVKITLYPGAAAPDGFDGAPTEEVESMEAVGSGFLLFQRTDGTCYLGIPLDDVPNIRDTDVFLDIYHSAGEDDREELLARTYIEYMDQSENLIRFALSDENTEAFLAEYDSGIRCVSRPLRQEELGDGIYQITIRAIDRENHAVSRYIWTASGTYLNAEEGAEPLKLSENCRYVVNKGIVEADYQQVDYEELAKMIESSGAWSSQTASIEVQGGDIVSLTMDSQWYAYGISPVLEDQENPYAQMSEQIRSEELVDMLETYYTLTDTVEADVSEAPGMERLEIYRGNIGDGESGYLLVKSENGALLHSRFLHQARSGWGSLYLGRDPKTGQETLVEAHTEDRDDYGEERFCAYRLDEQGSTKTIAGSSFSWGDSYLYREDLYEEWISGRERYLKDAVLLISCDEEGFHP